MNIERAVTTYALIVVGVGKNITVKRWVYTP